MLAQHVVDQVGGEQHLPPRFLGVGEAGMDQAGDHGTGAESAFHQRGFSEPRFEIVAEHVGIEQRGEIEPIVPDHVRDIAEPPHRQRIFVGDEAERPRPRALQPARQQHPERLMCKAALERVADEIEFVGAGERFHHQLAHARHMRDMRL